MAKKSENIPVKSGNGSAKAHPIMGLRQDVDRIFDNFMQGWPSFRRWTDFEPFGALTQSQFAISPDVDVSETEQGYEISTDLPGIEAKDIEITLNNNVLTLKGEKKEEHEEKKKDYYLSERSYGTFQRAFTLPEDVDSEKINTQFSNGVLKVSLPKSAEAKAKTRKIKVKAA